MKKTSKNLNQKFVPRHLALKGGKTKADYIQACKEKGIEAVYSGKRVFEEGAVVRTKGFYTRVVANLG